MSAISVSDAIWSGVERVAVSEQSHFGPVYAHKESQLGPSPKVVPFRAGLTPPYIGVSPTGRPDPSHTSSDMPSEALLRWRHSQRRAEAVADWPAISRTWIWLTTPDAEQRAICSATHDHRGRCPARHGHATEKGAVP